MSEVLNALSAAKDFATPGARRLLLMEGPTNCNRRCSYCAVPSRWDVETASTLEERYVQLEWAKKQGYSYVNYVGGEPFAPFRTKEGLTFLEDTTLMIKKMNDMGMTPGLTTNGDRVTDKTLDYLCNNGGKPGSLSFSLHEP